MSKKAGATLPCNRESRLLADTAVRQFRSETETDPHKEGGSANGHSSRGDSLKRTRKTGDGGSDGFSHVIAIPFFLPYYIKVKAVGLPAYTLVNDTCRETPKQGNAQKLEGDIAPRPHHFKHFGRYFHLLPRNPADVGEYAPIREINIHFKVNALRRARLDKFRVRLAFLDSFPHLRRSEEGSKFSFYHEGQLAEVLAGLVAVNVLYAQDKGFSLNFHLTTFLFGCVFVFVVFLIVGRSVLFIRNSDFTAVPSLVRKSIVSSGAAASFCA